MKHEEANRSLRPVFRWAGSKRHLARRLVPYLQFSFKRYFEPFVGSGSLFFALLPESAVLGDVNPELINAYRVIRKHPQKLAKKVRALKSDERTYYAIRNADASSQSPFERAVRFVYLNRYSYNGVYRTNRAGAFNVPFGRKTGGMPEVDEFCAVAVALRRARLLCADFAHTLERAEARDLVYMDPPYHSRNRRPRGEYGYGVFGEADSERLVRAALELDAKGAHVMISYRNSARLRDQLPGWHCRLVPVRRTVASSPESRSMARELLITNWPLPRLRRLR